MEEYRGLSLREALKEAGGKGQGLPEPGWVLEGGLPELFSKPTGWPQSYLQAKRSLLHLCPAAVVSEAVIAWLGTDGEEPNWSKRDHLAAREIWPFYFPLTLRHLARLQLFVASFGRFGILRLTLLETEITLDVCDPAPMRPHIVMQRETGLFKVYRNADEDEIGGGYRQWRDFIYRHGFFKLSGSWNTLRGRQSYHPWDSLPTIKV